MMEVQGTVLLNDSLPPVAKVPARFVLGAPLGAGSFGVVAAAADADDPSRLFAIKRLGLPTAGPDRARSQMCRFVPPLIHFIPDS